MDKPKHRIDLYQYPAITNAAFRIAALTDKIRTAVTNEYLDSTKEAVYAYAGERKILPFVANLMCKLGLDWDFWSETAACYRERNTKVIHALDQVFLALGKNGVTACFVSQNFGALLASGTDISMFASGDVDLCGRYSERGLVERTFLELGFTRIDRYCGKRLISSEFQNDSLLPEGFHIGVEYDTLSRMKLPEPIKAENFVEYEKLWRYADTSILLPPIDALTYICLVHISLHSFSRAPDIRLYIDVENCLKASPDIHKVLSYAEKDRTLVRVVTALQLTKKLFNMDLPSFEFEVDDHIVKRANRLQRLVFHEGRSELIYEPSRIQTMRIELAYYDDGKGLKYMMLPDSAWKDEVYGGHGFLQGIRHCFRVIR